MNICHQPGLARAHIQCLRAMIDSVCCPALCGRLLIIDYFQPVNLSTSFFHILDIQFKNAVCVRLFIGVNNLLKLNFLNCPCIFCHQLNSLSILFKLGSEIRAV